MKLLSLDPSSTCVGYAVMTGRGKMSEQGRLVPSKSDLDAIGRITEFGDDLGKMLPDIQPDHVVIEVPSGHTHGRLNHRASHLAIYGMAVGWIIAVVKEYGAPYTCIDCNEWTDGKPKEDRTRMISLRFKKYKAEADPGGDVADAIGLGDYWFSKWELAERSAAAQRVKS